MACIHNLISYLDTEQHHEHKMYLLITTFDKDLTMKKCADKTSLPFPIFVWICVKTIKYAKQSV